jgi:hypothetical protein
MLANSITESSVAYKNAAETQDADVCIMVCLRFLTHYYMHMYTHDWDLMSQ